MVGEIGAFAGGEQVFLIALRMYLVSLIAFYRGGRLGLIALEISHSTRAPDFIAALPREVIELLPDVPK